LAWGLVIVVDYKNLWHLLFWRRMPFSTGGEYSSVKSVFLPVKVSSNLVPNCWGIAS